MASGKITLNTPKSTVEGYIKWSSEAGTATGNYSLVSASIYLRKTDGYTSWGTFSGTLSIAGTGYSFSKYASLGSSYVLIFSKSGIKVNHNSDGTKSITIGANFKISDTTIAGTYSASKSVTLDTIKRLSYSTGPFDIHAGEDFIFNITRYSSSYVHDVTIRTEDMIVREVKGYGERVIFSAAAFHSNVFTALDGSLSKPCTIELVTRSGDTVLGSYTYSGTITAQSPGMMTAAYSSRYIGETQAVSVSDLCSLYDYTAAVHFAEMEERQFTLTESGAASFTLDESFGQNMPTEMNAADCKVVVEASYSGITVGQPLEIFFNVVLPDSLRTIDFDSEAVSYTFLNADITGSSQKFISGAGTVQLLIPSAAQAYGQAYITGYQLTMGEKSVTAEDIGDAQGLTLELTGGTGQTIVLTVFDSRGNTKECVYTVSDSDFIAYTPLNLTACSIYRENGFDTTVRLHIEGTAWKGNFGIKDNSLSFSYSVQKAGESEKIIMPAITGIPIADDGTFSATYSLSSGEDEGFDIDSAYVIEGTTADCVMSREKSVTINSAIIGMFLKRNQDKYHVGINCRPDEEEQEAESQKSGLSVQGEVEVIGETGDKAVLYTDEFGTLNLEGGLNLLGSLMLSEDASASRGSFILPSVTKKGLNYIELDLGTHMLAMNWGRVLAQVTDVNTPVATAVSFQQGLFSDIPTIMLTPRSGVIGTVLKGVSFNNETESGFDVYVNRTNATNFYVHWFAVLITEK